MAFDEMLADREHGRDNQIPKGLATTSMRISEIPYTQIGVFEREVSEAA
jgi:hypothetical protein